MKEEISLEAVFLAVNELAQYVTQMDERFNGRMDSLEARFDKMEINTKQEFDKVHDKLDVMETQMTIFAGNLSKTQAEVMVLKNAR